MKSKKNLLIATLSVLVIASAVVNVIFYRRYQDTQDKNPDVQTQRIVADLKKTIALPDETPSVLTVVDKSKLTDSEIAKDAENGDKILLFQKSGEVIIYRPSTHKLINILNLTNSAKQPAGTNGGTTNNTSKTNQPSGTTTKR